MLRSSVSSIAGAADLERAGLVVYFTYSRSRSSLGRGIVEVVDDIEGDETAVPIDAG